MDVAYRQTYNTAADLWNEARLLIEETTKNRSLLISPKVQGLIRLCGWWYIYRQLYRQLYKLYRQLYIYELSGGEPNLLAAAESCMHVRRADGMTAYALPLSQPW